MLRDIQRKYYAVLRPLLLWYLSKPRQYRHNGLYLKIYPGVFHPKYFFSTQLMCRVLERMDLNGKKFCEVGAGSGLLSFVALKRHALVTAFDLNPVAVQGISENLNSNFDKTVQFEVYHSDLFDQVPAQKFDLIFINPPWFFRPVSDKTSLAWNCGANGEYFTKLFNQLPAYMHTGTEIWMILADNTNVARICAMAESAGFNLRLMEEVKVKWEKNYIFKLMNR